MPRIPPASMIHASASASRSATIAPAAWPLADESRDEVVHLAHVLAHAPSGARDPPPPRRAPAPTAPRAGASQSARRNAPCRSTSTAAHASALTATRLLPAGARLLPDVLERREVEVALRREVAVDDRLGDARGARDLGGRRAAVAALDEDASAPSRGDARDARRPPCAARRLCSCAAISGRAAPPLDGSASRALVRTVDDRRRSRAREADRGAHGERGVHAVDVVLCRG